MGKTLREQALDQLESLYQSCVINKHPHVGYNYESWNKLDREFRDDILQLLNYMRDSGWITYVTDKTQCPMNIQITSLGIDLIEKNFSSQQSSATTIQIGTNYGVAATHASQITIQNGISITDIENLINGKISDIQEKQEVLDAIRDLKELLESETPIAKGRLSQISSFLERHSWLSSPIASLLLQYATGL